MWFLMIQSRESLLSQRDGGHDRREEERGEERRETECDVVIIAIRYYVNLFLSL